MLYRLKSEIEGAKLVPWRLFDETMETTTMILKQNLLLEPLAEFFGQSHQPPR